MLCAQPPANPQSCVSEAYCNGLCSGAVRAKLGSWQWGCREGLGAGVGSTCPRMKLCCSCRGGSCPGESWHHLQECSLQGGEYLAGSHLCTVCAALAGSIAGPARELVSQLPPAAGQGAGGVGGGSAHRLCMLLLIPSLDGLPLSPPSHVPARGFQIPGLVVHLRSTAANCLQ